MKIGRYQLRSIRKRFWVFLILLLFLLFMLFSFWPRPQSSLEAWNNGTQTAFSEAGSAPVAGLRQASLTVEDIFADKRFAGCGEDKPRCIYSVQNSAQLVDYWNPSSLGIPFRFRAYLPSQEAIADGAEISLASERPSLYSEQFSSGGWSFRPAILLDALTIEDALAFGESLDPAFFDAEAAAAFSLGAFAPGTMQLGFQGGIPASGAIYDFDAMLFSTSNAIDKPSIPLYAEQPVPTLLVRDFRRVGTEEVLEPASEIAPLDISYAAGGVYQLQLHNFEWPADGKARMCVTLSNLAPRPVPIWEGLNEGMRVRIGDLTLLGVPAPGSSFEAGAAIEEIQSGESLSGYIVFGLEQEGTSFANVSGSPSEQEVRLAISSLLQVSPNSSGTQAPEVFIELSNGQGSGVSFEPVRRSPEDWVSPLLENETCSG